MSHNTKIRTYGVQFTKHAVTIGIAAVVLTFLHWGFLFPMKGIDGLFVLVTLLPFGLFFAGLSYVPVFLIHDHFKFNPEDIWKRIGLWAATVFAAGVAVWLAVFALVVVEYVHLGPQPDTLSFAEMFTSIAGFFFLIGPLSCLFFALVRVPLAIAERRGFQFPQPAE